MHENAIAEVVVPVRHRLKRSTTALRKVISTARRCLASRVKRAWGAGSDAVLEGFYVASKQSTIVSTSSSVARQSRALVVHIVYHEPNL